MIDPAMPDFANHPASNGRAGFRYAPSSLAPPAISIITPFFNAGPEFQETIVSVWRQSLQQWEWIIINDGSSDPASLAMLAELVRADPRVRVVSHEGNRGVCAARNTGFREAATPYVLQLDSDNMLEPTAAEKWFWYLETHPTAAFVKGFTVGFGSEQYLWPRGFHERAGFLERNLVDATALVRREVHQHVGGYDETNRDGLEDWQFWLRCASQGFWGGMVPEYLEWYRRRDDHSLRWPNWDEGERQARFHERMKKDFPRLWRGEFPPVPRTIDDPSATIAHHWPANNCLERRNRRLLLIVPWMAMGGADRFNLDLLRECTRRGIEVSVATTRSDPDPWHAHVAALTPDTFALHRFLPLADHPRFLAYLVQSRQVDVAVVSHSEMGYRLLPYLRSRFPRLTLLDYTHVVEPEWYQGGYPRFAIEYQEQLDLSVASSAHLASWMVEHGHERSRIRVCHTNVDVDAVKPDPATRIQVRRAQRVANDVPVILFIGRLCSQKRPDVLIEALVQLRDQGSAFEAWVVGDGPDLRTVRDAVALKRLSGRVKLMGAVPPNETASLLMASDILCLPSAYEGIALVLFEAMAAGLAVVATDVGGQRELVTEDTGVLVPVSDQGPDAGAIADALSRLLSDPDLRSRLGRKARERVESNFRLAEMGSRFLACVDEAEALKRQDVRPRPSAAMGRASATSAVELARLWNVSFKLWNDRVAETTGQRLYLLLNDRLSPLFRWGIARGWTWLPAVGVRVRRLLLRV